MGNNGSPDPIFETDEQTYVLVTLPLHSLVKTQTLSQTTDQVNDQDNKVYFSSLEDIIKFVDQANDQASDQASDQAKNIVVSLIHDKIEDMLMVIFKSQPIKRSELFHSIGLRNHSDNRRKYLDPLINYGWVEMEFPDKRTSPNQRYKLTKSGENLFFLIVR
jgi:ATP-dependent DNA helicase RecG